MSAVIERPPAAQTTRTRGSVLGYYLAIFLPIVLLTGIVAVRLTFPWTFQYTPVVVIAVVLSQIGLAGSILWSAFSLYGFLRFGAPADRAPDAEWRWNPETLLIVAYVSRGDQPTALKRSMTETYDVLCRHDVHFVLEAVTDLPIAEQHRLTPRDGEILYELVPPTYQTPRGTRFKARALQYLLERRTVRLGGSEDRSNVWVLHLDEESRLTPEALLGIREFTEKYDLRRSDGAIGQGEILYNGGPYGTNPLVETVDAYRTGYDLGCFRVQFSVLHRPIFGIHGSFVLIPATMERAISWDGGGRGCITEDAWFALSAMERKVRFDWVEGYILEQSPFTLIDLIQQRRRWFCGLCAIGSDPTLQLKTRLVLRLCIMTWALSLVGIIFGILAALLFGSNAFPPLVMFNMAVCGGAGIAIYTLGAFRNVLKSRLSWGRRMWILGTTLLSVLVLWPPLVEGLGVLYAIWKPMTEFYIVRKEQA